MSELYPSSSSDEETHRPHHKMHPLLPLIITSKTFNCIDHFKLLGFANITHAFVLKDSAPLLRHYLFDTKITTTDIKSVDKCIIHLIDAVHVFHDDSSNSADVKQLGDWLAEAGVKVYVYHCAPNDTRSGLRT
jgi:hypothetical protein